MLKLDINNPDFMHGTIGAGIMGNIFISVQKYRTFYCRI